MLAGKLWLYITARTCLSKGKSKERHRKREWCAMNNANDRSADEKALHDLFQKVQNRWNQGDGQAFAASFTEDADYIDVKGTYLKGRQSIAAAHQQLFETRFQGRRLDGFVKNIRFLSDDVALVHLHGRPQIPSQAGPAPQRFSIQSQ